MSRRRLTLNIKHYVMIVHYKIWNVVAIVLENLLVKALYLRQMR